MSKNSMFEVKSPCSENWDEMKGSQRVRFCSHCAKDVNNLSEMTRKEAMRLVRQSNGGLCIRYAKHPVTKGPLFSDKLHLITRRAPTVAAGVMSASLSLSTLAYAQGGTNKDEPPISIVRVNQLDDLATTDKKKDVIKTTSAEGNSSISGTVADPNGAVIPGVLITLTNEEAKTSRTATSNEEGFYKFENLPSGIYHLQFETTHFTKHILESVAISDGTDAKHDVALEPGEISAVVGFLIAAEYANPLHQAVANDDLEGAKNLIIRGANFNGKDKNYDNITPLFLAVENGNFEIARFLLEVGAKVNARDKNRQTPLMRLDDDSTPELVDLLVKHGAKPNLVDKEGNSALIWVSHYTNPTVLQALIALGIDVNLQNDEGQTALMNAVENDEYESVRVLILAGEEVNLKNKEGETAWDLTDNDKIENLLEMYGAVTDQDTN